MSRAYRIRVSESLRRTRTVEDHVESRLPILAILAPDRMGELLAAELAARGFAVADGRAVLREGGIEIAVDLASMNVVVRIEEESAVDLTTELEGSSVTPEDAAARARLAEAARAKLEQMAQTQDLEVRKRLTAELESALTRIHPVLDEAVNATLRTALRERAAQLGQVQDVQENRETGEMTIRIKV